MNAYFSRLVILLLILLMTACSVSQNEKPISSETIKAVELEKAAETETPQTEIPQTEAPKPDVEQTLDNYLNGVNFSGSVLFVKDNKVKIAKGYNMANSESKELNGPDTIFRVGDMTYAFTAAAILQLQEQGKLKVEDPVVKYLKGFNHKEVTIYGILTHTSGVPHFLDPAIMNIPTSVSEHVAKFNDKPLDFETGSEFAFNKSSYVLLGAVIEAVSGQSYNDYMHDHIFAPLGMERSGYSDIDRFTDQIAVGYSGVNGVPAAEIDMSVPYAAGGIYSTANDLNKWIQGLETGKILNAASWESMRTPNKSGYALGWVTFENGTQYVHGGEINGFSSTISRNITAGTTMILLSNVEGTFALNNHLGTLTTLLESM